MNRRCRISKRGTLLAGALASLGLLLGAGNPIDAPTPPGGTNLTGTNILGTNAPAELLPPEPPPETPRDFFNAGTRKLKERKLRESEGFLESALFSQEESLRVPAMYNLGHVRFEQGKEELKKSPPSGASAAAGRAASRNAGDAISDAEAALESDDLQRMVAAYLRGRGARKELRAATDVVKKAWKAFGNTLNKWQRASADFKGAHELKNDYRNAKFNADVVDRNIARLIDSLRELEAAAAGMGDKKKELGEKMRQLRGRIPEMDMPPGAAGDEDEEEEDQPMGPQEGQQEGPIREGEETPMSPEEASWLLDGFKLNGDRRLPMGESETGQPRDRNRPTW